jgi:hypothetical protein
MTSIMWRRPEPPRARISYSIYARSSGRYYEDAYDRYVATCGTTAPYEWSHWEVALDPSLRGQSYHYRNDVGPLVPARAFAAPKSAT